MTANAQARSINGARNILRTLSAMFEDAITDEVAEVNPVRGVRIRSNDPRCTKFPTPKRVYTFEQMHDFAAAVAVVDSGPLEWVRGSSADHAETWAAWKRVYAEPMVRTLADCGLRLGQLFGLHRQDFDGEFFHVRGSAYNGVFVEGDQPTKRHVRDVPVPPTLAAMILAIPPRIDTPILFPTVQGKIWRKDNFAHRVWRPTRARVAGMDQATPQTFRASWETHLRAQGVDPADLAAVAGHSLKVADSHYVQPLNQSYDAIRRAVG